MWFYKLKMWCKIMFSVIKTHARVTCTRVFFLLSNIGILSHNVWIPHLCEIYTKKRPTHMLNAWDIFSLTCRSQTVIKFTLWWTIYLYMRWYIYQMHEIPITYEEAIHQYNIFPIKKKKKKPIQNFHFFFKSSKKSKMDGSLDPQTQ